MNELMVRLESQMRALKLKGMIRYYREFSERAAQGKLQYKEYLSLLLEEELRGKTEGSIKTKIHKARFPFVKTLEAFDFSFQPGLGEKEILKLSSLDLIDMCTKFLSILLALILNLWFSFFQIYLNQPLI